MQLTNKQTQFIPVLIGVLVMHFLVSLLLALKTPLTIKPPKKDKPIEVRFIQPEPNKVEVKQPKVTSETPIPKEAVKKQLVKQPKPKPTKKPSKKVVSEEAPLSKPKALLKNLPKPAIQKPVQRTVDPVYKPPNKEIVASKTQKTPKQEPKATKPKIIEPKQTVVATEIHSQTNQRKIDKQLEIERQQELKRQQELEKQRQQALEEQQKREKELQRAEQQRLEQERVEQQRLERERIEKQRAEQAEVEKAKAEQERLAREQAEREVEAKKRAEDEAKKIAQQQAQQAHDQQQAGQTIDASFISRASLTYPKKEQRRGREGSVTFRFVIGTNGKAKNITVVNATSKAFEKSAKKALNASTFSVTKINGVAYEQKAKTTFKFQLN